MGIAMNARKPPFGSDCEKILSRDRAASAHTRGGTLVNSAAH